MSSSEAVSQAALQTSVEIGGRVLARNTVLNLIGQVVPLLVGVASTPFVIHHLGPDRYGILSIAWMVVGYFALFDLGIGPATTKFVAELLGKGQPQDMPALVWTALATQSGFGLVAGVLLAGASPVLVYRLLKIPPGLHADALWVFLILAASLPINFATGSLRGVLAATQRFDLVNAISIPLSVVNYVVPAGALALGFDLPPIVLFLVMTRLAALAAHAFFCLRLYPALAHGWRFSRSLVRPLLGYGGWVTVSGAVGPVLVYFERFLLGALVSVAAIGVYTPPTMITTKLAILPDSLTAALFPAFSASAGRGDSQWISNALVRCLKYMLLVAGPVALVLVFFARPILDLWVGGRFAAEGTAVLQILAAGALINSLACLPQRLLQGVGRPDLTAKFYLLELPLHVALAWLFVRRFGLPGAALAWSVRVGIDFVLLIVAACWVTRTSPRLLAGRDMARTLATLAALAVSFSVLSGASHAPVTQALLTLLLAGAFFLLAWHYALDLEEKWHIRLWFKPAR